LVALRKRKRKGYFYLANGLVIKQLELGFFEFVLVKLHRSTGFLNQT
jgi:hypothetical protein